MIRRGYQWLVLIPLALLMVISVPVLVWLTTIGNDHTGSDYSSFTGNIVRGQQEMVRLRADAMAFTESSDFELFRDRLVNHLLTYENRRNTFLQGLADSGLSQELYQTVQIQLDGLTPELEQLRSDIQGINAGDTDGRRALREQILALEGRTAFVYSTVHELVHQAAAEQKRFMYRLIHTVAALVVALLLFGTALVVTLLAVMRQGRKLERLTVTDMMTGLYNRRGFEERAQSMIDLAERAGTPVSLALADIDHFKHVNDQYGHPAGDRALQHFARQIEHTVRKTDLLARMGGEEFAFLMPDTGRSGALELCERIRHRVQQSTTSVADQAQITMTVSIGVVSVTPGTGIPARITELYSEVDKAMYEAKDGGRNRVVHRHWQPGRQPH